MDILGFLINTATLCPQRSDYVFPQTVWYRVLYIWRASLICVRIPATAAVKLLQLCPTLCDPIDGSPPGCPVLGILQARTLEWVAISFSNAWKWKVKVKSLSHVQPQIISVAQSCQTLCDQMNCSTPGLPVHHQLPEYTQTQVHWVSDAIQPSHPLSSPSPLAPNPSQHQSLFQWVNSSHEVAKVLEFQL